MKYVLAVIAAFVIVAGGITLLAQTKGGHGGNHGYKDHAGHDHAGDNHDDNDGHDHVEHNAEVDEPLVVQNVDTAKVAVDIAKERAAQTLDAAVEQADFEMIENIDEPLPPDAPEIGETVEESIDEIDEIVQEAVEDINEVAQDAAVELEEEVKDAN